MSINFFICEGREEAGKDFGNKFIELFEGFLIVEAIYEVKEKPEGEVDLNAITTTYLVLDMNNYKYNLESYLTKYSATCSN